MHARIPCPSEDQLMTYARGDGDETSSDQFDTHLTECEPCRAAVSTIADPTQPLSMISTASPGAGLPTAEFDVLRTSGDILCGRYLLTRFLAAGGMGRVYEAEDLELRQRVAIKMLRQPGARQIERFRREISLARKVTHPNVCRVYDLGIEPCGSSNDNAPEVVFLTMEVIHGETLSSRLCRGPIELAEAARIAEAVTSALSAAHGAGIVHRDLKSANILLEAKSGRVVVTDFGLAWSPSDGPAETAIGSWVGTASYIAPEQLESDAVTEACDIYSLGVVLYEMVTGRRPFIGLTSEIVAIARLYEAPPSPRRFAPALPQRWEHAILRCLSRNPQDRFASVDDLMAALRVPALLTSRQRRSPQVTRACPRAIAGSANGLAGTAPHRRSTHPPHHRRPGRGLHW